jgi:osmotically-inducible protein OsmY
VLLLGGAGYYIYAYGWKLPWRPSGEAVSSGAQPSAEDARIADLEIRGEILQALARSPELGGKNVEVKVENKLVTLKGSVETPAQRNGAEQIARAVNGVAGITNEVTVTNPQAPTEPPATNAPPVDPNTELSKRVEFELFRSNAFDTRAITITAADGTVTLAGTVRSRAEQLLAERIAQGTPGVRKTVNELKVAASAPTR